MSTQTRKPSEKSFEMPTLKPYFKPGVFERALAKTRQKEIEEGKRFLDKDCNPVMIAFPSNDL